MGEDYEAMQNFKLFAGGKSIAAAIQANVDFNAEENDKSACSLYDNKNHQYEWGATIESDKVVKDIMQALGIKQDRIYSKRERKLFICTVEHYGQVEFTLHDWQAKADGFEQGIICLVCPTPRSVKTFLRMKGLGKVTYKITKRLR